MPQLPPKPCAAPGCPALVTGARYCVKHIDRAKAAASVYDKTTRLTNAALALAAQIRNSHQWQKVRALHKAQHPLCVDPLKLHPMRPTPAAHSHHIKDLAMHPELAFDLSNLAALCTQCHAAIEAMERKGEATQHLFMKNPENGTVS